jgi:hypothetical protein
VTPHQTDRATAETVNGLPTVDGWPRLAPEALHGPAGRLVEAVSPFSEGDPVATLASVLVGFGNLVGGGPHAKVQHDRHPARLNVAIVGESGHSRKGLSLSAPRHVLAQLDPEWAQLRMRSGLSSGEGVIYHVRDAQTKQRQIIEKGRVVDYQDVIEDHGEPDKRLFCLEPELAAMLKRMAGDTNSLSAVLRQAFDDMPLSTLTKNSPMTATGAHVSVLGHTTPDELRLHLSATETVNGFGNRFIYLLVRRAQVLPDGDPVPESRLTPIVSAMRSALARTRDVGQVHRDPSAAELWRALYPTLSAGEPGLVGAILGRAEAHVLRLSLVYALLDGSAAIRVPHLEAATSLWDYATESARRIFGGRLGITVADTLLEILRTRGSLTTTEIHAAFGRHRTGDEIRVALEALQTTGKIRPVTTRTGGRDSTRWEIVP